MRTRMHVPIENRTLTRREILLVEDDPEDERLALGALRQGNIMNGVHVAHDSTEALQCLFCNDNAAACESESLPAVVLLDLNLPHGDGWEVLRQIRLNQRTSRLPVVVLSSSQGDARLKDEDEWGASGFISKPIDFEKLINALGRVGMYWVLSNEAPSRLQPRVELTN